MEYKTGTFIMGVCTVITTKDKNGFWQMVVTRSDRSPSYADVVKARYKYLPDDIVMAQMLPAKKDYNLIPYNAHLLTQLSK